MKSRSSPRPRRSDWKVWQWALTVPGRSARPASVRSPWPRRPAGSTAVMRPPSTSTAWPEREPASLRRVEEALGGDVEDRLDLVARRPADADDLGGEVHRDPPRPGLRSHLRGAKSREAGERVRHAVHRELRPALPEEVRRHRRRRHLAHHPRQLPHPRRVPPVQLPHLEPHRPRVRPHRVPRLVQPRPDRDHAPQRPPPPRHRRHPLVVHPVLEVHHHPVRLPQIRRPQRRRPRRVVRLHRHEHRVEPLRQPLHLVQVQRPHLHRVLAARAAEPQPLPPHRLHVLRPLVDQRHVAPRLRQQPAHDAPDRARPDDADPVEHARAAYSRTFAPGKAALYFRPITPNHVKQRLRAGKACFGSLLNFGDPLVAELMASAGFDWLLADTEHGPIDLATLATMFATITRYPCAPFVRVHALSEESVKRVLDAGAWGVLAPNVRTREEAQRLAAACKYPPQGAPSLAAGG